MTQSLHNTRKYHAHIPKTDKTEQVSRNYVLSYRGESYEFSNKMDLYDFLHRHSDAKEVFIVTIQKLVNL